MDRAGLVAFFGLLISIIIITVGQGSSLVLQKPYPSALILLALSGAILHGLVKRFPTSFEESPLHRSSSIEIELQRSQSLTGSSHSSYRPAPRFVIAIASILIVVRVELQRQLQRNMECSGSVREAFWPLVYALLASCISQPSQSTSDHPTSNFPLASRILQRVSHSRLRNAPPALLISLAGVLIITAVEPMRSTYICSDKDLKWTRIWQIIGLISDSLLLFVFDHLVHSQGKDGRECGKRTWQNVVMALLLACLMLLSISVSSYIFAPKHGVEMFDTSSIYFKHLLVHGVWVVIAVICALHTLLRVKAMTLSISATVTYIYAYYFVGEFYSRYLASSWPFLWVALLFGILNTGVYLYFRINSALDSRMAAPGFGYPVVARSRFVTALILLLLVPGFTSLRRREEFQGHPIDSLRSQAVSSHRTWLKQASASRSLEEAVKNYQARYGLAPPPGFGEWYTYATHRNSAIIDDFDSINNDLLPFWSISPQEIRRRTWEITSDPGNEVFALRIRDGKIDLGPNRLPTHRWMMEGVQALIQPFVGYLPDMDLALNLNDESRVAVEWEDLRAMLDSVGGQFPSRALTNNNTWNPRRAVQWRDPFEEATTDTMFEDHSFTNSFHSYAARTCPPSSRARCESVLDRGKLCVSCASPHSHGPFISDWNLAGDVCHQPDLANLHGFFLSPAAFKTTRKLVPVFSQSKVAGYNDILYPSAWNYMDKVKYEPSDAHPDPPYHEKKSCLFWRGGTTEGYSHDGAWRGMVRQRLVWLTNSTHRVPSNLLLVPTHGKQGSAVAAATTTRTPADLPATDISIVEGIDRCAPTDCAEQAGVFALTKRVDFQDHWRYKYLFDLDGAGFSGRFISFLQSRSIPFKTALFREWYQSRLTPWLHFVPLDVRLHGVYSTLTYFAGLTSPRAEPHHQEGESIANEGRQWANKVLRKEDMEIYMFRLLLELGRLTDDRREELGFVV